MEVIWPAVVHLPQSQVLVISAIVAAQGPLLPEEGVLLRDAVPARRREIIAGRRMAHLAMSELELNPASILFDRHGAPFWPTGLCGSIAHSPTHVAVVVARTGAVRALGIDIEDGRDLGAITSDIASEADITAVLTHHLAFDTAAAARFAFSAKEALFKCQAPMTDNQDLDFLDVRLAAGANGALFGVPAVALPPAHASVIAQITIILQEIHGVKVAVAWA